MCINLGVTLPATNQFISHAPNGGSPPQHREGYAMDDGNYLLGRQPILNRNEELVAYELLFRSPGAASAEVTSASHATAEGAVGDDH